MENETNINENTNTNGFNIGVEIWTDLDEGEQNTMMMKEVINSNDCYQDSDAGYFWMDNQDEFKNGKYYLTYDLKGITKIERVEEHKDTTNAHESFRSDECVICLKEKPNVMFCNCGHIAICAECESLTISNKCPVCRQENTIKRKI